MRIFLLGAGATGGLLARVLRRQGHQVLCGDRDPDRARPFLGRAIPCVAVNARSQRSVADAAGGCDLLVNAVPAVFNETVIRAALQLRVDYLDLSSHRSRNPFKAEQLGYHQQFVEAGRLAVINAGVAPGLTNLLAAACAETLDQVQRIRIRLFEETRSKRPISSWSAEAAYDEAVSRPPVYRDGKFRLAERFSEGEVFCFPNPIGQARVFLAAQDEVASLPYFIPMKDLDVKIGGKEFERLRRWCLRGRLGLAGEDFRKRFPKTSSPLELAELMRDGGLGDALFAVCVSADGRKGHRQVERRRACVFPSLHQLSHNRYLTTPIAFATARSAAAFIGNLPAQLAGVYPPEALPREIRRSILRDMRRHGFRLQRKTVEVGRGSGGPQGTNSQCWSSIRAY